MAAKAILVLCAQALFIQGIFGQCAGNINSAIAAEEYAIAGNAFANNALTYGAGGIALGGPYGYGTGSCLANYGLVNSITPTNGGGFAVTSASPISPTGIMVISENAIEGALAVNGELPFLGAVALEGALPTAGAGAINYGCGNGAVGIVSEGIAPAVAPTVGVGYGPGLAGGFGSGAGLGGRGYGGLGFGLGGCGCGGVY